jgi:hypothetical protein
MNRGWTGAERERRGAGDSGGRTSWTARPEAADYATVAGFLLQFLHRIRTAPPEAPADDEGGHGGGGEGRTDAVFAGYSYGSLVVTRLPDPAALLAPFATLAPGKEAREVATRARMFAEQLGSGALRPPSRGPGGRRGHRRGARSVGGAAGDAAGGGSGGGGEAAAGRGGDAARRGAEAAPAAPPAGPPGGRPAGDPAPPDPAPPRTIMPPGLSPLGLDVHYLLVSPILPPISTLTALPFFGDDADGEEAYLRKFRERPSLAVFGSGDVFTSARRLAAWCEERRQANARFDWFEVPGAGHFWHERGAMAEATRHVKEWIERNMGD